MASITPACGNANAHSRYRRVLGFIALAIISTVLSASGVNVETIEPRALEKALAINGAITLDLTSKVEEALSNGIPIEFVIDARLYRRRALVWDETIQSWRLRRRLNYHALSGLYFVTGEGTDERYSGHGSLNEALRQSGQLFNLILSLQQPLNSNGDYRLGVRVWLDIEALPPLLRPVAYTSRGWDLHSGWTTWKVQR